MRPLSAVVNDVARAMRRQGKAMQKRGHFLMATSLIAYADQLRSATHRQSRMKTKRKTDTR